MKFVYYIFIFLLFYAIVLKVEQTNILCQINFLENRQRAYQSGYKFIQKYS